MAHISDLVIFQHVAGETQLTSEQVAHLKECGDCAELEIQFRQVIQHFGGDLSKAKRDMVEEEKLPEPELP
jgi:hypothetical protein